MLSYTRGRGEVTPPSVKSTHRIGTRIHGKFDPPWPTHLKPTRLKHDTRGISVASSSVCMCDRRRDGSFVKLRVLPIDCLFTATGDRRGAWWHQRHFCVAGVALMAHHTSPHQLNIPNLYDGCTKIIKNTYPTSIYLRDLSNKCSKRNAKPSFLVNPLPVLL